MLASFKPQAQLRLARLKYSGGGDWYSSRTALGNLARFCNQQLGTSLQADEAVVEAASPDIANYPFVFMTGHGNVIFSSEDARNLRQYLLGGGFLHICDNYGMDPFIRPQLKKVFPELDLVELPFTHPVYNQKYKFPAGLPKVHEHDGKAPKGYGLVWEGRLVCFYDYECDLGNGWEDATVYNNPESVRLQALRMGANLLQYAFNR